MGSLAGRRWWIAAAVIATVVGCGRGAGTGSGSGSGSGSSLPVRPERSASEREVEGAPVLASGSGSDAGTAGAVRIPDETRQLVVVTTAGWDATAATMRLWQRHGAGWRAVGAAWPAVVGRSGLAWGQGVHGDGPPAGQEGPRKHEGDGKSPAGLFTIGPAYGYDRAPPPGTRLPYTTATETWRCVDDPGSRHYNRLLDERTVTPDWSSREELRRADDLYRWVVEIEHNRDGRPGAGSCIFLHVWSGPGTSTAGCTAMEEPALAGLLTRLDPAARPMVVLLTTGAYAALATPWGLPPR